MRRALSLGWIMTVGSSARIYGLSSSSAASTSVLGKTSTALEVLKELNASKRLADYACQGGTAVVTGGSSGIGVDTVSTLALTGMTVILCVRDVAAGEEVRSRLPEWCQPNVRVQLCDLADLTSVQQAAHSIAKNEKRIDLLVNNAGVMAPPRRMETAQGFELQFGTNHVGHHFLTRLLLPSMAEGGRIVTLASTAHTMGKLQFDNLNYDKSSNKKRRGYTGWNAYGQSKLANILFAKGLDDKLKEHRSTIQSVSLHPGVISTNLWKYTPFFLKPLTRFIADKSPQQGAATSIFCSLVEPNAFSGGEYCSDCQIVQPNEMAQDKDKLLRTKLWDETERLIAEAGFETPKTLK
jgi:NAD(P)-dependent dehydrogenase (short-subunit alcohol dehydrogenase family)